MPVSAGVQSSLDVNQSPIVNMSPSASPSTWSMIWFVVAVAVVIGFHIKIFGTAVPPVARFP